MRPLALVVAVTAVVFVAVLVSSRRRLARVDRDDPSFRPFIFSVWIAAPLALVAALVPGEASTLLADRLVERSHAA